MFYVDEPTAEAIRRVYFENGEWLAVVEFRRHFPLISDEAAGLRCVRTIAGWQSAATPSAPSGQVIQFPARRRAP